MATIKNSLQRSLIGLIKFYQFLISPFFGPSCRFYPSCSSYAIEALKKHHVLRALWLITFRIMRCHPLHPGGIDLVPEKKNLNQSNRVL